MVPDENSPRGGVIGCCLCLIILALLWVGIIAAVRYAISVW